METTMMAKLGAILGHANICLWGCLYLLSWGFYVSYILPLKDLPVKPGMEYGALFDGYNSGIYYGSLVCFMVSIGT
jgi:hypothetical protein